MGEDVANPPQGGPRGAMPRLEWQANHLRVSLFLFPGATGLLSPDQEWRTMTGQEQPEQVQVDRRMMLSNSTGRFLDGQLRLVVAPRENRVSWELSAIGLDAIFIDGPPVDVEPDSPPSLGEFTAVRDRFLSRVSKWMAAGPEDEYPRESFRIAFAGTVSVFAAKHDQIVAYLKEVLPFIPSPETLFDLSYRRNRLVASARVNGMHINRLATWTTGVFYYYDMPSDDPGPAPPRSVFHALELSFDVNTQIGPNLRIPPAQAPGVLEELADWATRIVEDGDRP